MIKNFHKSQSIESRRAHLLKKGWETPIEKNSPMKPIKTHRMSLITSLLSLWSLLPQRKVKKKCWGSSTNSWGPKRRRKSSRERYHLETIFRPTQTQFKGRTPTSRRTILSEELNRSEPLSQSLNWEERLQKMMKKAENDFLILD